MSKFGAASVPVFTSLLMAGCLKQTHEYRYGNGSYPVAVVVEAEGKAKPAVGRSNAVYLAGVAPPRTADQKGYLEDRVLIGRFKGLWAPSAIAWVDAATVNVCPLNADRTASKSASVLVTETTKRTFRITTDCEAFHRAQQRPAG